MDLDYYKNMEPIGEGSNARCYQIASDRVLKIFKKTQLKYKLDKFKYFLKYSNDSFLFPFEFIYEEDKFYGYIAKKSLGKNLTQVIDDSLLDNLAYNSIKLQKDIDYISEGKILMVDFNPDNVMYDGNKFEIIDTDFYENWYLEDVESIKKKNERTHRIMLTDLFIVPFLKHQKQYKHKYIVDRIKGYRFTDIKVNEFIMQMKEELEKYYKEEITKLSDLENILRR